ncbi:hypothetical protein Taro_006461 [Colocasia esculenta]|uniref:Phosphatidylinositol-3,4,5-trisphosphate 3-phosphatase n=1 Tax=Colocasia esculenta TaxID=4460 RepID=A0A843TR98_COLES|nr:hypothetical protein [Colocasia esculenta]
MLRSLLPPSPLRNGGMFVCKRLFLVGLQFQSLRPSGSSRSVSPAVHARFPALRGKSRRQRPIPRLRFTSLSLWAWNSLSPGTVPCPGKTYRWFLNLITLGARTSKQGPVKVGTGASIDGHHKMLHYLIRFIYIRNLVSKKRRRMLVAGYDLDMSYITDRLLAMSFPAEHMRAFYRNPLWQVKTVLDMRHQGHYKVVILFEALVSSIFSSVPWVYNLCAEESYDPSHFHGHVETFPFDDNHVPSLKMIKIFCESVHSWLSQEPQNIAAIHCMAGKGRTGLMVCTYLVYTGMLADEALQLYADRRTTNNHGVSIASQRRYIGYWSQILEFPVGVLNQPPIVHLPPRSSRELLRIRLYDTVHINSVFFVVSEQQEVAGQQYHPQVEVARSCCRPIKEGYHRNNSPRYYLSFIDADNDRKKGETDPHIVIQMDTESSVIYQKTCLDYYFEKPVQVSGDLRVIFYEKMIGGRLFYACFNTAFIKGSLLQFKLRDLDKVSFKGKSICGLDFCVELLFGPANAKSPVSLTDYSSLDYGDPI